MKRLIPILNLVIGEFLLFYGKVTPGLFIHAGNLLIIILLIIFGELSLETKIVLQSLTLLLIYRIINFSMPYSTNMLQHLLIYGVMLIPIFSFIKNCKKLSKNTKIFYIYLPVPIIMIMILNFIYHIKIITETVYGEIMAVSLIILLSISALIESTKYWNEENSNILKTSYIPMLLTFIAIIIKYRL